MNVIIPPTPQLPPQATCVPQICRCSKLTPVCSKMTLNGRFPMCSKMTLIRCSKMTLVPLLNVPTPKQNCSGTPWSWSDHHIASHSFSASAQGRNIEAMDQKKLRELTKKETCL